LAKKLAEIFGVPFDNIFTLIEGDYMARPQKDGMDYFPHDSDAVNDEKIEALRVLYGNDGYAFYFILLERIYRTAEFELDISDAETIQILCRKVAVTQEQFDRMLETALKRKCFDRDAYEQRGVLTSSGIKKRASVVQEKRENMRSKYKKVSDAETTPETKVETPQRKGKGRLKESKEEEILKESKEEEILKESKEEEILKESKEEKSTKLKVIKNVYGEKVHLMESEYGKLIAQHGEAATLQMISILDNWYLTKGNKPNTSDYHTMVGVGWVLKRFNEDQQRLRGSPRKQVNRPKSFDAIDQWVAMTEGMDEGQT